MPLDSLDLVVISATCDSVVMDAPTMNPLDILQMAFAVDTWFFRARIVLPPTRIIEEDQWRGNDEPPELTSLHTYNSIWSSQGQLNGIDHTIHIAAV